MSLDRSTAPRSYLYVPGTRTQLFDKALRSGADALLLDLEDSVPMDRKEDARHAVASWLREQDPAAGPALWVRVNAGDLGADDVQALAGIAALSGLGLAKTDDVEQVRSVAEQLDRAHDERTVVMPLIESASGVLHAEAIAGAPRVRQLQIGEVDLAADLGVTPGPDEIELAHARSVIVVASAASRILPPVGPVSRLTSDPDALELSTRRVRRLGFFGRACIHPAQIPVVHRVFTPTRDEAEHARRTLDLLAAAQQGGDGAVLDDQGRLVDEAVLRSARLTIDLASRAP